MRVYFRTCCGNKKCFAQARERPLSFLDSLARFWETQGRICTLLRRAHNRSQQGKWMVTSHALDVHKQTQMGVDKHVG